MIQDIEAVLRGRLGKRDLQEVAEWASQSHVNREKLFTIAFSNDDKISANAIWCLTHLRKSDSEWLQSKQDCLIDALLSEDDTAKKRMLLQLLREQKYSKENIRVDFLDFCLSKINSECEPYAIRCFSLYISIKMCKYFPELISELEECINMLSREPLSPGMKCAVRKVSAEIRSLTKA